MKYKQLFEQCITRYNGEWHCYHCKVTLQNLEEVQHHSEVAHSTISAQIFDFLKFVDLSNKKCKTLVKHGIVVNDVQRDYFCLHCERSLFLHDVSQHVKEKRHKKCINAISQHFKNRQENSSDNTSNKQDNVSVNIGNPTEHTNESNLSAKVQPICNKSMKSSSNNSMQMANKTTASVPCTLLQETKKYKHFLMQQIVHYGPWYCHLCKSMLQSLTDVICHLREVHPDINAQIPDFLGKATELLGANCRDLLNYEIAMQDLPQDYYCVSCQCSLPSVHHFPEHSLGKRHKCKIQCNKTDTDVNIVLEEFENKQQNLNDDTIDTQDIKQQNLNNDTIDNEAIEQQDLNNDTIDNEDIEQQDLNNDTIDNEDIEQQDLNNDTIDNEDIEQQNLNNDTIDNEDIEQQDLNNDTIDNEDIEQQDLNNDTIDNEDIEQQDLNNDTIDNEDIEQQDLNNDTIDNEDIEQQDLNNDTIDNEDIEQQDLNNDTIDNEDIEQQDLNNDTIDNEDIEQQDLNNDTIDNEDIEQQDLNNDTIDNEDIEQQDLNNDAIDNEDIEQQDLNNDTIDNEDIEQQDLNNDTIDNEAIEQQNLNNYTIDNQNVSVVLDGNDSIKNCLSNFRVEEKSTVSYKSSNKDNVSHIPQTLGYVNAAFCCLCDMFFYRTTVESHMTDKSLHQHMSAASVLKISPQQASCIIKLEEERKTVRALQLNIKKFDKTVWPEYTVTKYTCDQCNKMIEEDDIINHEITVHKSGLMSSMKSIYSWSPMVRDFNVVNYYPLFRCSFCNEIIHGILSLQAHFSKYEHDKNVKLLIDIKRCEYDSCKDIQIYLEPLELLSLISFENNDGTVRIQEQPVIYVKNHCTTFYKDARVKMQKFIYVCFNCQYECYNTHNVINHLCGTLKHLQDFKNIFFTYEYIHNVFTSRELGINESEHEVSPVSREDVSVDNGTFDDEKKRDTDETQENTGQYCNNSIAEVNVSSKNDRLCQNEENNSGFFISLDIFMEMNKLIKNVNLTVNQSESLSTQWNKNALDRYNKTYDKEFLSFEEIMFTCNERKLNEIKLNLGFFLPYPDKMICLLCNDSLLCNVQKIYEHINSVKHTTQFRTLYNNKEHFELLMELVKIQSENLRYAKCFACNIKVYGTCKNTYEYKNTPSMDYKLHINSSSHKNNRRRLRNQAERVLEELQNLWYDIQHFACAECDMRFKMKIRFMEHLNVTHKKVLDDKDNSKFDFCLTCATLWYKNESCSKDIRINYQVHCKVPTHKYLQKSNDYGVTPLPESMQKLLRNADGIAANLFKLAKDVSNDPKVIQFTDALKHIFKTRQLPVEVCIFGSRITGLALTNSDIDIYLNFGYECTEPELIKSRSKQIQDCLRSDQENWDIELTLDRSRTPIIKVKHRSTGLQCDISFSNGLSVENSKFIRSFNAAYPPCQKLTLFLKKWLSLGGLTGPEGITNYALVWMVIFYLQVKFKEVRSIAALIKSHNQSKIVSGWETGVGDTISIDAPELSTYELLLGFFEYYGSFNYMRFVVCPLLGKTCSKKAFAEVSTLHKSMTRYIAQLKTEKREYFRVDSSMCVQDPFDLSHNLTKAVPILTLKRFKHYCNESLSLLRKGIATSPKRYKHDKSCNLDSFLDSAEKPGDIQGHPEDVPRLFCAVWAIIPAICIIIVITAVLRIFYYIFLKINII